MDTVFAWLQGSGSELPEVYDVPSDATSRYQQLAVIVEKYQTQLSCCMSED